jgi:peptide/nickel transport system substrate-binding protein
MWKEEHMSSRTTALSRTLWKRLLPALGVTAVLLAVSASGISASHQVNTLLSAPRSGGSIAIRTEGPTDCLTGQLSTTNVGPQIQVALADPLITKDQKGNPSPDLATSWKVSAGGKRITFFLRRGVRFSNGDPFDASTVKWNYDHVLNPKTKSAFGPGMLGPVKAIKVLTKYTVQIVMKTSFRPFFTGIAGYYLGLVDPRTTRTLGSHECTTITATGPFKLKSVGPAFNPVVVVRNPDHTWASPWQFNHGPAYLNQITFKPIVSDTTAISELLSGGVDVSEIAPAQISRVQHNQHIAIRKYLDEGGYLLLFNLSKGAGANVNVRRAIAEAIDRSTLVKAAANGLAQPSYSPLAATIPDYDPQSAQYAAHYNPADARNLLKGIKVPTLTLVTFNDPTSTLTAEYLQAVLGQVGINVSVQAHAIPDAQALVQKGSFDLYLAYYSYADPDVLYLFYAPGAPGFEYSNPTLTRYLTTGRTSNNPAVVRRSYIAAQRFMNRNMLVDPLFTLYDLFGINKRVHGWHVNFFTLGYAIAPVLQDLWVSK